MPRLCSGLTATSELQCCAKNTPPLHLRLACELGDAWQRLESMSVRKVPEVSQALLQRRHWHRQSQQGCRKGGLASHVTLAGGILTVCRGSAGDLKLIDSACYLVIYICNLEKCAVCAAHIICFDHSSNSDRACQGHSTRGS